jgi:SAM-dependent methyltransferase
MSESRPRQIQTWQRDDAGEAWQRSQALRARYFASATEKMLDLADIKVGHLVLDVAAGTGDQSIDAARRAGPSGHVLATDLSTSMLHAAAKTAAAAGLENVETLVSDAQELDADPGSFDAAICRLGLMFFPDRQKALAAIRRALKPGARFATVVWSAAEKNPALTLALEVVEPHLPSAVGPLTMRIALSMGEPGLLEDTLATAGFRNIAVHTVQADRRAASVTEALEGMRAGPAAETLNLLPEVERGAAWRQIEDRLASFQGPDGVRIPGELLVGVGSN